MGDKKNSLLLDVDDTALKNKLLLEESLPDDFESLLPLLEGHTKKSDDVPWKWVQPLQGLCVKTQTPTDGSKVFINICHTTDIPSPHNLDEETLLKMYASLDEDSPDVGIRVPLSISDCHEEMDKSGAPARAYDIAVSSEFFEQAQGSRVHLRFLVQVAIEAVSDKYKLDLSVDQYTVLKNRKAMGKLQRHRIEQREVKKPLIQELSSSPSPSAVPAPSTAAPPPAQKASAPAEGRRSPERCRLLRRSSPDGHTQVLVAELAMADVTCASEVSFSAGEDRLRVESARRGYSWDVFLPLRLDADAACATFVRQGRVLNIQVPILAS